MPSTARRGKKWEAVGFVLIAISTIMMIASPGNYAVGLGAAGFIIFLIGRFK